MGGAEAHPRTRERELQRARGLVRQQVHDDLAVGGNVALGNRDPALYVAIPIDVVSATIAAFLSLDQIEIAAAVRPEPGIESEGSRILRRARIGTGIGQRVPLDPKPHPA
jgi:hypothetical protein